MNIQTERLEKHTARLTVELTNDDLDKAKKQAANKLSTRFKIPGFRKGKAPYNIVLKYLGEASILEEAIEIMGNDVYPKALAESQLRPYAPGSMDDFKLEPVPTYTFTVALQPEVELNDYRSVRVDYVKPVVTDEALERTMEALRQQEAPAEENTGEIAVGDRVTLDIHSQFVDGEDRPEDADEEEHVHDHDHDHDHEVEDGKKPFKGDSFFHRHDAVVNLNPDNEPFLPGFIAQIVGNKAGDTVEFELTVPEGDEDFKDIGGRVVQFNVELKKAEKVELPVLDDSFAQKITATEANPLNLEQLTLRVRENLQREAETEYDNNYADLVLDKIVEGAAIAYPELMVSERIEDMIKDFEERLKQQKITLEIYASVTGVGKEQLAEQYHPEAEKYVKRSLVLGEVLVAEQVGLNNAEIDREVDILAGQFGEQASRFRALLNTKDQRDSIANRLLYSKVMSRMTKIGKGESLDDNKDGVAEDETVSVENATPAAEND